MSGAKDAAVERALDLLTGRNGSRMAPADGAAALEHAARAGSAEASERAAVVAAAGFGRPQSWTEAVSYLTLAATRGHSGARAQLALLAGVQREAVGEGDWGSLAQKFDLRAWIDSRPAKLIINTPRIGMATGFLAPDLCAWMIEKARPLQKPALVYHHSKGAGVADPSRSNTVAIFTILDLDVPMVLLRNRVARTLNVPVLFLERFSVFRYLAGQRFTSHVDYLDPSLTQFADDLRQNGQRVATFLVYLNEEFEAGETHFLRIGQRLKGRTGDGLFFYNLDANGHLDRMTIHEGVAPTSGEKWLLSQFIRDKDLGQG
ncbi:MAG: 2OG-Fe(II) oxygenase [Hyphomonadaceae bacterium]|nr:2OG-Fe(II) oxygenase [Hyphomonadaceae bacterium]